jgi:hypothetical protein
LPVEELVQAMNAVAAQMQLMKGLNRVMFLTFIMMFNSWELLKIRFLKACGMDKSGACFRK